MANISSLQRSILELSPGEALTLISESRSRRRRPTQKQRAQAAKRAVTKRPSARRTPRQNATAALDKLSKSQKLELLKALTGD